MMMNRRDLSPQPTTPAQWKSAPTALVRAADLRTGHVLVDGSDSTLFAANLITATGAALDSSNNPMVSLTVRQITDSDWWEDHEPSEITLWPNELRLVTIPRWSP